MQARRISRLSVQLFIFDVVFTILSLTAATRLRAFIPLGTGGALGTELTRLPWYVYLIAVVCWSLALAFSGAYDPAHVLRWYGEAARVVWGSMVATILFAGALYMTLREVSRLQFLYFFVINMALLLSYRAALRVYYRAIGKGRAEGRSRVLIVGAGTLGEKVAKVVLDHSRWGYDLTGFLDDDPAKLGSTLADAAVLGNLSDLPRIVEERQTDEVWIALPARAYEAASRVVAEVERLPVRVKIIPDYFSLALVQAKPEIMGGVSIIGLREPVIEGFPRLLKRSFDLVVASALLVLSAPFLALIALLIKLDSRGPAVFRQQRVGENGRLFGMFKFRTMVAEAEAHDRELVRATEDGHLIHKHQGDPRVTRLGRVLRRFSLDELPQFLNVILGDMSLVGPRPELPWLVEMYDPWQRRRFAVPQGLTGWWQINGRSDKPMHLNTDDDLYYVYNYSLWLDIQILVRTPFAILIGRGAF
jgi:exopolysaccharide biosynthesis polyprenyl glycosylphosphotransferase